MKMKFLGVALFYLHSAGAHSASDDDLRVHYYFLRGSLAGQNQFAKSLSEFHSHMDSLRAKPFDINVSIYQKTQELIQTNPKDQTNSNSNKPLDDIKILSESSSSDIKAISKSLGLYSLATDYLTSGPMRASRAYEALGMKSEKDLDKFKRDIIVLISKQNAGSLSAEEQTAIDLLFQYYIGVPTGLTREYILNDPLMFPVKESKYIEQNIKEHLKNNMVKLTESTRLTQDIVSNLRSKIEHQVTQKNLLDALSQINEAHSFAELDEIMVRQQGVKCSGTDEISCELFKKKLFQLSEQRRGAISRAELAQSVEQSIRLGLNIAHLSGNRELARSFQALKAVNDAYDAVSTGVAAFSSASTTMGQVGAVAGAMTGVVGAAIVISSLMDKGPSADQLILESIQELKELVVKLSSQIEAGFADIAHRNDRIEALLKSYSNLSSKNDAVLQSEILALRESVRSGAQPLQAVRLSYAEKGHEQFRSLREKSIAILLTLPKDSKSALADDTKRQLTGLFAELFAIVSSVQRGEYKIFVGADQAANVHLAVLNQLAAYPPSHFRTAFLVQNAINASGQARCAQVNLIGLLMISDASQQLNDLLDNISHFQISNYFEDPMINKGQYATALKNSIDYIEDQRKLVHECISSTFFDSFERTQVSKILDLVENQRSMFFNDGARINDMLVTALANYPLPGGFHRDSFLAGALIQKTRSFEPEVWDKNSFLPTVLPIYDLGTKGFQITRRDYEAFIPTYQIRLGPNLGADFQLYAESYWTPIDNVGWKAPRNLNPFPLQIALASPRSKKLIRIWTGRVYPNWLTDPALYDERAQVSTRLYYRLRSDSLPRVYEMLNIRGIGLIGTMDYQYGNRDPWPNTTPQKSAENCNVFDGFYSCPKMYRGFEPYTRFVQGHYFTGPVCVIVNGSWGCHGPAARGTSLDRNSQFYNPYRKEFADGMVSYVNFVRDIVSTNLSKCLLSLVQGAKSVCDLNGFQNIYPDRSDEFNKIEQYSLLRMTIDFNSEEMRRISNLTDLRRIETFETHKGADSIIQKIDLYIDLLKSRLSELQRSTNNSKGELPPDIKSLLENGHDWLASRLLPYTRS